MTKYEMIEAGLTGTVVSVLLYMITQTWLDMYDPPVMIRAVDTIVLGLRG